MAFTILAPAYSSRRRLRPSLRFSAMISVSSSGVRAMRVAVRLNLSLWTSARAASSVMPPSAL